MERSIVREYTEALIIAVIFLRFTQIFILQTFYIPSGSMEKTLLIGDHLFMNRFIYGSAATGVEDDLLPLRDVQR
ncbi:MAG TPA: S26 family signal peptidase, partial [Thermoanaerobaculia bacterium]|nr:S26 family signal peptidase [Thermoanaerobaculia bacterium]